MNRLGQNCTRGAVVNRVQEDVEKCTPRKNPHSTAKIQVDEQYVQQKKKRYGVLKVIHRPNIFTIHQTV
ncbi:hypothetical protein TNCV_1684861 [Trichonephila clavipes]|nr:hypothetical protein TNCV_1684861 [Trichonephila clavipes]